MSSFHVSLQCPLYLAPGISEGVLQGVELGISGKKQYTNAALAVQMCKIVRNKGIRSLMCRVCIALATVHYVTVDTGLLINY